MSNNELTALPPQFGELKCLTSLNLETNSITQLPAEFCNLVALKELYLSSNRITNLPAGMSMDQAFYPSNSFLGAFVHIEQFSMESNQLQTFPDCSSWEKLKRVRLSFNALVRRQPLELTIPNSYQKEFPKISAKHNQLQVIELTGNEITSVPKDISSLESLETLLLSYNKIDDLPDLSPLKGSLKVWFLVL
jgi:leucine-rich repeat protein SHOC2